MSAAKRGPAVPAAHRCAYAAASHLAILEPDRLGFRDVAYDGGGRFSLYRERPPFGAGGSKREREEARAAFYDAPAEVVSGKRLAELVGGAYVELGPDAGSLAGPGGAATARRAGKAWHVFDEAGRLVYVGATWADARRVLGLPEPVPVDHSSLPPMVVGRATLATIPADRRGRFEVPAVVPEPVSAVEVAEVAEVASEPEPVAPVVPIRPEPEPEPEVAPEPGSRYCATHGTIGPEEVGDGPDGGTICLKCEPEVAEAPEPEPVAHVVRPEPVAGELPPAVVDWLERLVYRPKRAYADAYVRHLLGMGPLPADPGQEWAEKARKRADRVVRTVNA